MSHILRKGTHFFKNNKKYFKFTTALEKRKISNMTISEKVYQSFRLKVYQK